MTIVLVVVVAALLASLGVLLYLGAVTGAVVIDTGWYRRTRPLGPLTVDITASRETVYALLTQPYLGRATKALTEKVKVIERGTDMVLAAHRTPIRGKLTAVTVETVTFAPPRTHRLPAPAWTRPPRHRNVGPHHHGGRLPSGIHR